MYGSSVIKVVSGSWRHFSLLTNQLRLSEDDPAVGVVPRGTMVDMYASDREEMVLGTGQAIGFITQGVDEQGLTGLQGFKNFAIGKLDRNVKKGHAVSIRAMIPGSDCMIEVEGLGAAMVGNLVATEGTGLLSAATAKKIELSVLNGCWRVAQAGDIVLALVEKSNLTPETDGNVRLLIKMVSGYVK